MVEQAVACGACGASLNESPNVTPDQRKPCSQCGSLRRAFGVSAHEKLEFREQLRAKAKRPGMKRPLWESVSGDDLHRASGQWNKLERSIDRQQEPHWYTERITEPKTGQVIREVSEPLKKHQGRGSAKRKRKKGTDGGA